MTTKTVTIEGETFTIRHALPGDVSLIFPSWMEAARELRNTRRSVFDAHYPDVVRSLLETEPAHVATWGDDTIVAWACGRPPNLLHFAWTGYKFRGIGLGRAVIEAVLEGYPATVWVTSSPLGAPNHRRFVYNPFLRRVTT